MVITGQSQSGRGAFGEDSIAALDSTHFTYRMNVVITSLPYSTTLQSSAQSDSIRRAFLRIEFYKAATLTLQ